MGGINDGWFRLSARAMASVGGGVGLGDGDAVLPPPCGLDACGRKPMAVPALPVRRPR